MSSFIISKDLHIKMHFTYIRPLSLDSVEVNIQIHSTDNETMQRVGRVELYQSTFIKHLLDIKRVDAGAVEQRLFGCTRHCILASVGNRFRSVFH